MRGVTAAEPRRPRDTPRAPTPPDRGRRRIPEGAVAGTGRVEERVENLRTVVPVFAHELVVARREAAALRRENARLLERIRDLQRRGRLSRR